MEDDMYTLAIKKAEKAIEDPEALRAMVIFLDKVGHAYQDAFKSLGEARSIDVLNAYVTTIGLITMDLALNVAKDERCVQGIVDEICRATCQKASELEVMRCPAPN